MLLSHIRKWWDIFTFVCWHIHENMLFSASPCWCCTCDSWWWWGWWWWWWYRLGPNRMPQTCLSLHPMECRSLEGAHSAASKAIVYVCVCVSVRGRCVWRVRGVMEGLGWPVEEGGAKWLLHKTKAPYAAASLSLSVFICQPLLSLYLWPAFILNGLTYFSQYSA